MSALHRDRELMLISDLCRQLAQLGLGVGMTDARPAVLVRRRGRVPLVVELNESGEFFTWGDVERHPTADVGGAAGRIAGDMS